MGRGPDGARPRPRGAPGRRGDLRAAPVLRYVAELLGADEQERRRRELELLLPGSTRPYVGDAGFREPTGPGGESLPTRDRASCCMFYTLAPEDTCAACPRTCEAERVAKPTAAATG